jgi:hypothetical protein
MPLVLILLIGGIYDYAAWMGSGAMMYKPISVNNGSGIQKLIGEYTLTETQTQKHIDKQMINKTAFLISKK